MTKNNPNVKKNYDKTIYQIPMRDGIKLYISKNNVVLSPGIDEQGCIPPEYFKKIETI